MLAIVKSPVTEQKDVMSIDLDTLLLPVIHYSLMPLQVSRASYILEQRFGPCTLGS